LAARFAAKEALAKAVGDPALLSWAEIEIVKDSLGKPSIQLHGETKSRVADLGINSIQLSLSHEQELASAFVVLEAN
jgi:holo-[acyl-carrier protein] synthase